MKSLCAAVLAALALPGAAQAGAVDRRARRPAPGGARSPAVRAPAVRPRRPALARAPASVRFRTRSRRRPLERLARAPTSSRTDPTPAASRSAASAAGTSANPYWAGTSNALQFRRRGRVTRLRAFFVARPPSELPLAPALGRGLAADHPRASAGGADEAIRRAPPLYAPRVQLAVVHHTAGTNAYTRAQSAAIVRGIEVYHVKGNGWNDIGYNFLVDRYGQVFEGRYGGIDRNVVGAHAQGFNTGSVGIALIGNYQSRDADAPRQLDALEKLLAWRLDLAHVDPLSTLDVHLRRQRAVPGRHAGLPARRLGPPRHRPRPSARGEGSTRSCRRSRKAARDRAARSSTRRAVRARSAGPSASARGSRRALPWTVTVTDTVGDGRSPRGTRHRAERRLDVGRDRRPAGPLHVDELDAAGRALRDRASSAARPRRSRSPAARRRRPPILTPERRRPRRRARPSSTRSARPALVTAAVIDPRPASPVAPLLVQRLGATRATTRSSGSGSALPDGRLHASSCSRRARTGRRRRARSRCVLDRTLAGLRRSIRRRSRRTATGALDSLAFAFRLTRAGDGERARAEGHDRAHGHRDRAERPAPPGPQDARAGTGPAPDGVYRALVSATDALGTVQAGRAGHRRHDARRRSTLVSAAEAELPASASARS